MTTQTSVLTIDYHIHLYPCFLEQGYFDKAFSIARSHFLALPLEREQDSATRLFGLGLCERADCSFFKALSDSNNSLLKEWQAEVLLENRVLRITSRAQSKAPAFSFLLFAGRQIVTKERLELLSLGSDERIPDGTPFAEGVESCLKNEAFPVLNWALGKWMFARKPIVEGLLRTFSPDQLFLGDTSLRPTMIPTPAIMIEAQERGFRTIAGSDPLPFTEEQQLLGTYGMHCEIETAQDISSIFKSSLYSPKRETFGSRSNIAQVAKRNALLLAQKHL